MIKKDELGRIATMKRISLENAEKDYLLDVLLFNIYSNFGNLLILKGGTSLYKMYNLNRFSEDLDFTLNNRRFDPDQFNVKLMNAMQLVGIYGKGTVESHTNEVNIKYHIKGPMYSGGKQSLCYLLLNISRRERVMNSIKEDMLIPAYKEIPSFKVFVMNETEIMAEKVRAIMTRNKPRDV